MKIKKIVTFGKKASKDCQTRCLGIFILTLILTLTLLGAFEQNNTNVNKPAYQTERGDSC